MPTSSQPSQRPVGHSATEVTQEVRFAVVMYGGVSLCIYINGVAQELLELSRVTAFDTKDNVCTRRKAPEVFIVESHSISTVTRWIGICSRKTPTPTFAPGSSSTSCLGRLRED
jgi:hypothetical protein